MCYSVTKETSTFIFITNIYYIVIGRQAIISGLKKTGDNICLYKRAWGV